MPTKKTTPPKISSIDIGHWRSGNSQNYTLYGVGADGKVYVFRKSLGWVHVLDEVIPAPIPRRDAEPF